MRVAFLTGLKVAIHEEVYWGMSQVSKEGIPKRVYPMRGDQSPLSTTLPKALPFCPLCFESHPHFWSIENLRWYWDDIVSSPSHTTSGFSIGVWLVGGTVPPLEDFRNFKLSTSGRRLWSYGHELSILVKMYATSRK